VDACDRYGSTAEFPLPLETKDMFEPWMPATAMERWGFVVIAFCTPSHCKLAERLKQSLEQFGLPHSIQVIGLAASLQKSSGKKSWFYAAVLYLGSGPDNICRRWQGCT
jgi:hypothetical protein